MNLKQVAQHFNEQLNGLYEQTEIASIFAVVVEYLSGWSRAELNWKKEDPMDEETYDSYTHILAQLKKGVPMQYALGETIFYGLPFNVSPAVLIPRPETEELVDWIIADCRSASDLKIIDIGTGSGCIAITLEKNLPQNTVFGLDVSKEALEVAKDNRFKNESKVIFIEADIRDFSSDEKFDVIVSNPPYITMDEKNAMHENVLAHEPHLALFVPNERPLVFYEAIADFALRSLKAGGLLYFEINEHLGSETVAMLAKRSFSDIVLRKDMQGKDRMIRCKMPV